MSWKQPNLQLSLQKRSPALHLSIDKRTWVWTKFKHNKTTYFVGKWTPPHSPEHMNMVNQRDGPAKMRSIECTHGAPTFLWLFRFFHPVLSTSSLCLCCLLSVHHQPSGQDEGRWRLSLLLLKELQVQQDTLWGSTCKEAHSQFEEQQQDTAASHNHLRSCCQQKINCVEWRTRWWDWRRMIVHGSCEIIVFCQIRRADWVWWRSDCDGTVTNLLGGRQSQMSETIQCWFPTQHINWNLSLFCVLKCGQSLRQQVKTVMPWSMQVSIHAMTVKLLWQQQVKMVMPCSDAAAQLRSEFDIVQAAVGKNESALQRASFDLLDDIESCIVTAVLNGNWLKLHCAAGSLRANWQIVLATFRNNGRTLEHMALECRRQQEVMLAAVARNEAFASQSMRADIEAVDVAVEEDSTAQHCTLN